MMKHISGLASKLQKEENQKVSIKFNWNIQEPGHLFFLVLNL